MLKVAMGQKVGMTRIFDQERKQIPITVLKLSPLYVTALKDKSVQLAFKPADLIKKPILGVLSKAKIPLKLASLFEIRTEEKVKPGEKVDVAFKAADLVKVTAISKGKGFAGTIKRHGFHRGPMSHGSDQHRRPGSIGSAFPQRVLKGKKMAGRMGAETVTVRNLEVVKVDREKGFLLLRGAVPGPNKGWVKIEGRNA